MINEGPTPRASRHFSLCIVATFTGSFSCFPHTYMLSIWLLELSWCAGRQGLGYLFCACLGRGVLHIRVTPAQSPRTGPRWNDHARARRNETKLIVSNSYSVFVYAITCLTTGNQHHHRFKGCYGLAAGVQLTPLKPTYHPPLLLERLISLTIGNFSVRCRAPCNHLKGIKTTPFLTSEVLNNLLCPLFQRLEYSQ